MEESLLDDNKEKVYRFRYWPIVTWSLLILIGVFFRLMFWPGASIFIIAGSAGLSAWVVTDAIFLPGKNVLIYMLCILCGCWFLLLIWGNLYNGGYPYNWRGVAVFLIVFTFYTIIYALLKRFAGFYKR